MEEEVKVEAIVFESFSFASMWKWYKISTLDFLFQSQMRLFQSIVPNIEYDYTGEFSVADHASSDDASASS